MRARLVIKIHITKFLLCCQKWTANLTLNFLIASDSSSILKSLKRKEKKCKTLLIEFLPISHEL